MHQQSACMSALLGLYVAASSRQMQTMARMAAQAVDTWSAPQVRMPSYMQCMQCQFSIYHAPRLTVCSGSPALADRSKGLEGASKDTVRNPSALQGFDLSSLKHRLLGHSTSITYICIVSEKSCRDCQSGGSLPLEEHSFCADYHDEGSWHREV